MSEVRRANGYKSAHATVCALKHRTTVCCPFAVRLLCNVSNQCLIFLPMIFVYILLKYYFLDFQLILFSLLVPIYRWTVCAQTDSKRTSEIFVNRLCTDWQQTDIQNIYQPFLHKCSVDDLCTNIQVHK